MVRSAFDVVIVGGGSAGCVLANRLSADPGTRVLVLEAGPRDRWWDLLVEMPAAMAYAVGSRTRDWNYLSEPEPHLQDRRLIHPRGKALGGSSSINGVVYQRGNPADYDRWGSASGMSGWDWEHCLPYFQRMEGCKDADAGPSRGRDGLQDLRRAEFGHGPLFDAFLTAAEQAGYARHTDINEVQEGFGVFDRAMRRGRRVSAAKAYLAPVRDRPNLEVRTGVLVTRVVMDGTRAVGVRVRPRSGAEYDVTAGEVILSGGAFASPQLLLLSGIGDAGHLAEVGVPVVADLPGVGRHLQDHLGIHVQHRCTQPVSMMDMRKRYRWPDIGLRWLLAGRGPATSTQIEAGGFVRTDPSLPHPDMMLAFAPIATRTDPTSVVDDHGYQLYIMAACPESRGRVKLRSTDPVAQPWIRFDYLSTENDRAWWPRAVRTTREILAQPAFAPYDGGETVPGSGVETDEQVLDWITSRARTGLHPTSTCRMGVDGDSVVDPETMRVHGVDGLRVIDASVMPTVVNANTYAPVMMLAERAADLILGRTPPPVPHQAESSQVRTPEGLTLT